MVHWSMFCRARPTIPGYFIFFGLQAAIHWREYGLFWISFQNILQSNSPDSRFPAPTLIRDKSERLIGASRRALHKAIERDKSDITSRRAHSFLSALKYPPTIVYALLGISCEYLALPITRV